jgi:hypothetical protein
MAASITVTPNPCLPSSTVNVHGAEFPPFSKYKLSSGGPLFKVRENGTFDVSMVAPSTAGNYTLSILKPNGTVIASTTFTVAIPIPPPPPPPPPPLTVPGIPTGLTATAGDTTISINWSAPSSNGGSPITGYKIYRNNIFLTQLGIVTTFTNLGLSNGTPYTYTVSALNAIGEGAKSTSVTATPIGAVDAPPVISAIVTSAITTTTLSISWHVNEPAQGWVEYGTTTGYGSETTHELSFNYQDHIQNVSGLTMGTLYHFRVHAVDTGGNHVISGDNTVTTSGVAITVPGVPTNLTGTAGDRQVILHWLAPTSNGGSSITGYRVYRNNILLVTLGNVLLYTDTNLVNGTSYTYTVSALNVIGEGAKSASASATPFTSALVISNVTVTSITETTALVSWHVNQFATGQVEYGLTTAYGTFSTLEPSFNYQDHVQTISGLIAATQYHYRVHSVNQAGLSSYSGDYTFTTAGVVTPPPPSPGPWAVAPPSAIVFLADTQGNDQSSAFANFLSANAGRQIALEPGKNYLMHNRIQVSSLNGWDLFGQGAIIRSNGYYTGTLPDSWLRLITCRDVRIRDIELVGPATLSDATNCFANYGYTREDWCGLRIDGGHNIFYDRVKAHGYWGDPLYIARRDNNTDQYASPDGITLTDCDFHTAGRNAVSLVAGRNINVIRGNIGNGGLSAWDTEPNNLSDATHFVTFTGTHFYGGNIGDAGMSSQDSHGNSYVVYISAGQGPAHDYTLNACTFDIGAIYVRGQGGRNSNITITNCSATTLGDATFQYTDNVVFSGNTNINRVNL